MRERERQEDVIRSLDFVVSTALASHGRKEEEE